MSFTLRGFRHSAAGRVARKGNAAMGGHGGGRGDGIRRGYVRFQLHDSTKNPIANKLLYKVLHWSMQSRGGL